VKLKVGKTKPKASNYTDTSFKAKSIVLKSQSLASEAPSAAAQFLHQLALLKNKSDNQKSESLSFLTSALVSRHAEIPLPESLPVILEKLQPLLVSGSPAVRNNALKMLKALPAHEIARHPDSILLYTHVGMTHLSADIRAFSMDVLEWMLQSMGQEVVACPGGWLKTLKSFTRQLGWQQASAGSGGWSMYQKTGARPGSETKAVAKQMNVLAAFIRAGLASSPAAQADDTSRSALSTFPYTDIRQNLLPERSNVFAHLYLFGQSPDEEGEMYQDREERQRIFCLRYEKLIREGAEQAKKEAGEIGRSSLAIRKAIDDGIKDYAAE